MPTIVPSPLLAYSADARPTLLYHVGVSQSEAQAVVDISPPATPDAATLRIAVRFLSAALMVAEPNIEAFYDAESSVVNCGPNSQNMGIVLHELAHSSGHGHTPAILGRVPGSDEIKRMLESNRPFRDAHAKLLDFWEDKLSLTSPASLVADLTQELTRELEDACQKLREIIDRA